ncbi:MAG: Spy/CpxP family protein refolding chaperone [Victivallales bacterium]|nr:Spy/CpxP family protein refolding chaperone [Victivallales bacterium]
MKTKGIMLLAASLLLVVGLGLSAGEEGTAEGFGKKLSGQGEKMRGGPEGHGSRQIMEELNLTEEQREQMKIIHEDYVDQMNAVGEAASAAREAFEDVLDADDLDEDKIRELSKAAAEKNADMLVLRAKMMKELDSVLTPEQKKIADEKKAEFKEKRQARREEMKQRMQEHKEKMKQRREKRREGKDDDEE